MTVLDPKLTWGWNEKAMNVWLSHYSHVAWINSNKTTSSIDVICHKEGLLVGVGFLISISSCRSDQFQDYFHNDVEMDFKKFIDGFDTASALNTPLILFIYFEDDNCLMNLTLWRSKDGFITGFYAPINRDANKNIITFDCSSAPLLRG